MRLRNTDLLYMYNGQSIRTLYFRDTVSLSSLEFSLHHCLDEHFTMYSNEDLHNADFPNWLTINIFVVHNISAKNRFYSGRIVFYPTVLKGRDYPFKASSLLQGVLLQQQYCYMKFSIFIGAG
jgi:hypothetical protein